MTESECIRQAQEGNERAYEQFLEPYQPLLRSLARRFSCPGSLITQSELMQAGYVGLLQAAKRFDGGRGVQFATYALPWALGEMKRALRCTVDSMGAYEKRRLIASEESKLCAELSRYPMLCELAQACAMSEQEILRALQVCAPCSLDQATGEDGAPILEKLRGEEDLSLEGVDLRIALEKLPKEERRVVMLRYFRGRTQKETALALGKSQPQVSKLENRALDRLRELLT